MKLFLFFVVFSCTIMFFSACQYFDKPENALPPGADTARKDSGISDISVPCTDTTDHAYDIQQLGKDTIRIKP